MAAGLRHIHARTPGPEHGQSQQGPPKPATGRRAVGANVINRFHGRDAMPVRKSLSVKQHWICVALCPRRPADGMAAYRIFGGSGPTIRA